MTIADISYVPPQVTDTPAAFNTYCDSMLDGPAADWRYYVLARFTPAGKITPCERADAELAVIITGHGLM